MAAAMSFLLGLAAGAEPQCAPGMSSCYYDAAGYTFAESYMDMRSYQFTNRETLCHPDNWVLKEQCNTDCPLQVTITSPPHLRMSMCAQDNVFTPYEPRAHIDLNHPLNGKELELLSPGNFTGDVTRRGCNAEDFTVDPQKNFTGKLAVIRRGGCFFATKFANAHLGGALSGVMINHLTINSVQSQLTSMSGGSLGVEETPGLFIPRHYGNMLFDALDRGEKVMGKMQLVCDRVPPNFDDVVTDGCPSSELVSLLPDQSRAPCYAQQNETSRLCSKCPLQVSHAAWSANTTVCLWGALLTPRSRSNYIQMQQTLPLLNKELVVLDSGRDPCNKTSFAGLSGRTMAFINPSGCLPFEAVLLAHQAQVAAVVVMSAASASTLTFPEGPSTQVPLPVHSMAPYHTRELLGLVANPAANAADVLNAGGEVVGKAIVVDLSEGVMPPKVEVPEVAVVVEEAEAVVELEPTELQWTLAWTVPFVLAIVLFFLIVAAVVSQRAKAAEGDERDIFGEKKAACSIPLGVASTTLSLSIVLTVSVVAVPLAYQAGQDSTDLAVHEGKSAANDTYASAISNLDSLSGDLRKAIVDSIVRELDALLDDGQQAVEAVANLYLAYDGTWGSFMEKYNDLVELSRTSDPFDMSFLAYNNFYASEYQSSLHPGTPEDPVDGTALHYQTYSYNTGLRRNLAWAVNYAPEFTPAMQIGGTKGVSRHALVQSRRQGDDVWFATSEAQTNQYETPDKPLSVYTPVYSPGGGGRLDKDFYLGVAEARVSYRQIRLAINNARDSFPNVTVVVYDNETKVIYGTNRYSSARYTTQYYDLTVSANEGSYTLDNVPRVELNALSRYLTAVHAGAGHSGSFDQREYFLPKAMNYYVADMHVTSTAAGWRLEDVSGNRYQAEMRDGACVDTASRCVVQDEDLAEPVLSFDGRNQMYMYTNLTTDLPVVQATKIEQADGAWNTTWDPFKMVMTVPGTENYTTPEQCVAHTYWRGGLTRCMRREVWINSPHTVTMTFKPDPKPMENRTGWLISQTMRGESGLRILETGELLVQLITKGCRTEPIADLDNMGWTTLTAVVLPGSQICRMYVNGTLHDSQWITSLAGTSRQLTPDPMLVGGNGYRGRIAKFSILNVSASATEVRRMYDTHRYAADVPSREWYVDVTAVSRNSGSSFGIDWVVAALVPRDDIMRQVDANNEKTTSRLAVSEKNMQARLNQRTAETIIVLTTLILGAVLIFVVFNARLTAPFAHVARLMTDAAYMCITEVPENTSTITELQTMYAAMAKMLRNLEAFRPYLPDSLFEDSAFIPKGKRETAPGLSTGVVCLVFTDIVSSTAIWEACESGMKEGLKIHNDIMRKCIQKYNGYEVKTVGDCFMVAFHTAQDACNFGLAAHMELHQAEWPENLQKVPQVKPDLTKDLRGIRVRIGINFGDAECEFNPVLKRYDYFGSTVNKASRVEGAGVGGSVAITNDVMEELLAHDDDPMIGLDYECEQITLANVPLKGVSENVDLSLLVPSTLKLRAGHVQDTVKQRQGALEKDRKRKITEEGGGPSINDRSSMRSSAHSFEGALGNPGSRMSRVNAAVGKLFYTFSGDFLLNPMARQSLNACMSKIFNCLRRTEGALTAVLASSVVVTWNTAKMVSLPNEKGARFAKMVYNTCYGTSRVDFMNTLHVGLCGGSVLHGSIGNKAQKFITSIGPAVTVAEQLCSVAAAIDAYCLFAQTHPTPISDSIRMRPIDEWTTQGCSPLNFIVYEVMLVVSRVDQMSEGIATPANARGLTSVPSVMLGREPSSPAEGYGRGPSVRRKGSLREEFMEQAIKRTKSLQSAQSADRLPDAIPAEKPEPQRNPSTQAPPSNEPAPAAVTPSEDTPNTPAAPMPEGTDGLDIQIQIQDREPSTATADQLPPTANGSSTAKLMSRNSTLHTNGTRSPMERSMSGGGASSPGGAMNINIPGAITSTRSVSINMGSPNPARQESFAIRSVGSFNLRAKPSLPNMPAKFTWGWSNEYTDAFKKKDWETIAARHDDPVLAHVADNLKNNRHFCLPPRW
eukprot:TRINITY_DN2261_c0_g2_i1.p1 TRINITY_DN2261_c0_g2~~TRINITY_DN2261_c0_g2_i1.p1  ORF type:complete len:2037 (+),score=720.96 TRINITY_DN2261_c0_g2_i1:117-6227(+)